MSECCNKKCWTRFLPHNWLCLKGLSVVFLVAFYVCLVFAIYMTYAIASNSVITGADMWMALIYYVGRALVTAIFCLTLVKILKVLRKIKQAVAPCCCHEDNAEQPKENKKAKTK